MDRPGKNETVLQRSKFHVHFHHVIVKNAGGPFQYFPFLFVLLKPDRDQKIFAPKLWIMKNLLLFFFIVFSIRSIGQVNAVIPPEANVFYDHAMQTIKPEIKSVIEKNAVSLKGKKINMDSLSKSLRSDRILKKFSQQGLEAVTVLIMVQVSRNADAELKNLVVNMRKESGGGTDTPGGTSEWKVQNILANKSEIAENVALVMKKFPDSPESALTNLK
jgi:hypothetical protein